MKSPINSLNSQLQRTRSELKSLQGDHKSLHESHSKLIKEWVKQENELEELKDSSKEMCSLCSTKGTELCLICPLQSVALKFGFWEEG